MSGFRKRLAKHKVEGLSASEIDLIDRCRTIAGWIARGISNRQVIEMIIESWPTRGGANDGAPMSESAARSWIIKARQYIATSAAEDIDIRQMYLMRLHDFAMRLEAKMIHDIEEITVVSAEGSEGAGAVAKRVRRKVKPDALDVPAASLYFKVIKEHAIVSGARPKDGPKSVSFTQNNVQSAAVATSTASNAELLEIVGLRGVEILQDGTTGAQAPIPADVPALPEIVSDQPGPSSGD